MLKKRVKELVIKAALELGISKNSALAAYKAYWLFVKEKIESLPLTDITEEEFNATRASINIPGLGKFFTSYKRIKKIDKANEIIYERNKYKKGKTPT